MTPSPAPKEEETPLFRALVKHIIEHGLDGIDLTYVDYVPPAPHTQEEEE